VLVSLIAIGLVVAYLIVQGIPTWDITGGGGSGAGSGGGPGEEPHRVGGGGSGAGSGGGTAAAPHLRGVTAYDPFGSPPGQEHNADAPKATDGDPNSYWETESYHSTFAALGKQGVGLVLDAGKDVQLHQLGFATQTPGFTAV